MDELYRKLLAQLEEGQDTVLAFITEGDGSIPRTTGAYMLVGREGRVFGTIGGGNLEYQAVLHAQELVQEKKSEYREYDLGTGEGKGLGMVCGGRVKVCFYFMNGAHGEAESLAQALAAQERYRSYWIFFALDGTGIRVLEKEAWEMLPAAQEKAGHCRILELDGKTEKPYFYKSQVEKVKAIMSFMTNEPERHFTMEELSEKFDISTSALKQCFKGVYGTAIYTYMRNYRMDLAASLLTQTDEPITVIAGKVGYTNTSKFSEAFKKVKGKTPLEYRKIKI